MQYNILKNFMISCMQDNVHDELHIYRVVNYAAQIAKDNKEANFDVVIASALLHDIGRIEEMKDPSVCHAEKGSEKAKTFLHSNGYSEMFSNQVAHCILTHRHKKGISPQSLEAKILFDADKLDLIGCVGVARVILYGGEIGEPLYILDDDGIPTKGSPSEKPSLFREYQRKLKNLSDKLYTDTAKEIALAQQKNMNQYFNNLVEEINQNHLKGNQIVNDFLE